MTAKEWAINTDLFRVAEEHLTCVPFSFAFSTTDELEPLEDDVFIGQSRVEHALERGLGRPGHIFVVADTISTALLANLEEKAKSVMPQKPIRDLVCIYNFEHPEKPRFIELEKGQACRFEKDLERLFEGLKEKIPVGLADNIVREQENRIRQEVINAQRSAMAKLTEEMEGRSVSTQEFGNVSFSMEINPNGIMIYPIVKSSVGKRPLNQEEYNRLQDDEREEIDKLRMEYFPRVEDLIDRARKLERDADEKIVATRREIVDNLFREGSKAIIAEYGECIFSFIESLRAYTLEHIKDFLSTNENEHYNTSSYQKDPFLPFKVNVRVDNSKTEGIPVVEYRNVDYGRLFGEISYTLGAGGVPIGGHMNVRTGLLSEANHGVLVLSALDVLSKGLWWKLKAVLETKRLDIGSDSLSFVRGNVVPETLHIDVKLVLVGGPYIYHRVFMQDPINKEQFDEIFKTVAEFDWEVKRSDQVIEQFARLIRLFCERDNMPAVSAEGTAEFLKYLSRKQEDQNKFSLDMRSVKDLLNEAAWFAKKEGFRESRGSVVVSADNVRQAMRDKVYRSSLIREKIYESIENGDLLLSLTGSEVGQINGLSVFDLGYISFGKPIRVTCKTFVGQSGVISIDREAKMSGQTHDKGVLILAGYLGGQYGQNKKLALNATLSFEQSYSGIDGDSASAAELYAILSSLSGVPLRQDIAVTGSVNQKGEIQPVGGVVEKVEGFFDICSAFGLTGTQGVIIPHQNVKNLVLRDDVIKAVSERKFHVWAIKTVDEGMEILTGKEMGERQEGDPRGIKYPIGSINSAIEVELQRLAKAAGKSDAAK